MRHKFKFHKIDKQEEYIKIPLVELENILYNQTDLIVLRNNEQMWINETDLIFNNTIDSDDEFYKKYIFKFIPDEKTLTKTQLILCSKFHESYLNIDEFWEYINTQEFINVLQYVAKLRETNNIVPVKENMFDVLNVEKGTIELPKTLTFMNGKEMTCWNKLLTICKK